VSAQKVERCLDVGPEPDSDVWRLFLYAMKSPVTRDKYQRRLSKIFEFAGIKGTSRQAIALLFIDKAKVDSNWAFTTILRFLERQKMRVNNREISGATVRNYVKPIKLFCEMADIPIPWKKLTRGLPRAKSYADDRIPSIEELRKLLEYPDRRIKAIVCTMASSGIRFGAWDYLRWGNIRPIDREGKVIAAKIIVYAGESEQYFCYISLEAFLELSKWIQYREMSGEKITENSWLMHDLWDTRVAQGRGLVSRPKRLTSLGIKRLMERAIWAQGLRKKLEPGKKRHPFQANHSLRKWFKTTCEIGGMKPINVETLLSHSVGVSNSYYRPTETELLEEYLAVQDFLIINVEHRLQKEVHELEEKGKDSDYIIKAKLQEKDEQIERLTKRQERFEELIQSLIDSGQFKSHKK
jgi:site-specific recombinase XerC